MVLSTLITGTEEEGLEPYRTRVLIRYRKKPQGGAAVDYYLWATEVDGIVDALPYVLTEGQPTIFLVAEGSGQNRTPLGSVTPNPFPTWVDGQPIELSGSGEFLAVARSIDGAEDIKNTRRPITVPVQLLVPNYTGYKIIISGLSSSDITLIANIKTELINYFDIKRPNIRAIGYTSADALINSIQLSSIVQNIIGSETFTNFQLLNADNSVILTDILGIGCLAYLNSLIINGTTVAL